jgi:glycosyltransferase involved in cell wall biosynthesis
MSPKTIVWCGPHDYSGYGKAYRDYVAALSEERAVICPDMRINRRDKGVSLQWDKDSTTNQICVQHCIPDLFVPGAYAYNIGYTVWECLGYPPSYVEACNKMDEIWTATEWGAQNMREHGVTVPVTVIPHIMPAPRKKNIPADFTMLNIGHQNWRKGADVLLEALLEASEDIKGSTLMIRTTGGVPYEVSRVIDLTVKGLQILNIPDTMIKDQNDPFAVLYQNSSCYVHPARGEGWGLNIAEALSYGLPCIATEFGGHTEYLNKDNSILVPGTVFQVTKDHGALLAHNPLYEGCFMMEPNVGALAVAIRTVKNMSKEQLDYMAAAARATVLLYSAENIKRIILGRVLEIEENLL